MTVSNEQQRSSFVVVAAMLGAIVVTIVIGGLILSAFNSVQESQFVAAPSSGRKNEDLGVIAEITAGAATITRRLESLAWNVTAGQSLDDRLPVGAFRARCEARFDCSDVRFARLGARMRNGSLIIQRSGEVLLADHVGDEARTVLTTLPVELHSAVVDLVYKYEATGDGPWTLEAVWQPDGSATEQPLPTPVASRHVD